MLSWSCSDVTFSCCKHTSGMGDVVGHETVVVDAECCEESGLKASKLVDFVSCSSMNCISW